MDAEAVVIGLGDMRVIDWVIPDSRISRRQDAVVKGRVGRLGTREQH